MESSDFESRANTVWEVTVEQLRSWPRWDATKEPPLGISAAVEKAFQALPPGEKRADWQLNSVRIQQPAAEEARKTYRSVFFYFVSLNRKSNSWSVWECVIDFNGAVIPSTKQRLPSGPVRIDSEKTTIIVRTPRPTK